MLQKKSKQKISVIQRKLWEECRRIKQSEINDCYTCGAKNLQGSNKQLGHMWSKASLGAFLKYDLRILKWQCMRCNIHGGGMGADFYARMLKEKGKLFMAQLEMDRWKSVKAMDWYLQLLEEYKKL
jgi:hypothetical protein